MVGAGIVVDVLFAALGLIPQGPRPESMVAHAQFAWNYTTWLDLVALAVFVAFLFIHRQSGMTPKGDSGHQAHGDEHAAHTPHAE